jgi:hypothetical protein
MIPLVPGESPNDHGMPPVTATRQAEALALYRRAGFTGIPAYGECAASPGTSVCLAKTP